MHTPPPNNGANREYTTIVSGPW